MIQICILRYRPVKLQNWAFRFLQNSKNWAFRILLSKNDVGKFASWLHSHVKSSYSVSSLLFLTFASFLLKGSTKETSTSISNNTRFFL